MIIMSSMCDYYLLMFAVCVQIHADTSVFRRNILTPLTCNVYHGICQELYAKSSFWWESTAEPLPSSCTDTVVTVPYKITDMTKNDIWTILQDGAKQSGTFHFLSLYCINHDVLHVFVVFHVMVVVSAVYDCNDYEHYRLDISLLLGCHWSGN